MKITKKVTLRRFYKLNFIVFLLGVFLWQAVPAAGQDQAGGSLIIGAPETEAFPAIRFRMEAYDAQGNFLSNLKAVDLDILEDGKRVAADEITTMPNGLQITVALNTHPSFNTPVNGTTQYGELQAALADWVSAQPAPTLDDFSLATPTGLHLIRSTEPEQWKKAILEYQPDLLTSQPTLTSLADALDLATDPLGRTQMKRAIVFITPPLPPALLGSLPDYTSRAKQIGVKVFVWMVAPSATAEVAAPLQDLAVQTGGRFNVLIPSAMRPEIEPQLVHLRNIYEVQYTSVVKNSGSHRLAVQLKDSAPELISNERNLPLTVLPPNPIFLSPPVSLQFQIGPTPPSQTSLTLTPDEVNLKILIEFPDQHQRALKATRLFVNGKLVAENLQAPFDSFVWKVAEISQSGQQMLRVEALDTLNISGTSLEIPVDVVVENLEANTAAVNLSNNGWMAVAAVVVAGGALATVLITGGRKNKLNWRRRQAERSRSKDPTTQPVPGVGAVELPRKKGEKPGQPRSADKNTKSIPNNNSIPAPARLVGLMDNEQPVPGGAIALFEDEITFGSDPALATQVLASSTVDGLHARIFSKQEGEYYLADQNSVAGTWINYAPVNGHGAHLEDGDLVHIGRVMFRFERAATGQPRRPIQIIPISQEKSN